MESNAIQPILLIVPGMGNSGPEHWQTHLQQVFTGARRVELEDWYDFDCDTWVLALDAAIRAIDGPVILAGHSAGVIAIVQWAQRHYIPKKIQGALLVAPADFEMEREDSAPLEYVTAAGWIPIPREPLPFRSILVASDDDPYTGIKRSALFAQEWGSQFINLGAQGHINVASGYGHWPLGEELINDLLKPT